MISASITSAPRWNAPVCRDTRDLVVIGNDHRVVDDAVTIPESELDGFGCAGRCYRMLSQENKEKDDRVAFVHDVPLVKKRGPSLAHSDQFRSVIFGSTIEAWRAGT